jgi:hypothetical protein
MWSAFYKLVVLCFIVLFIPSVSFSQSIKHSNYNGFTGEYTIETSIASLKQGFSTGFGISYRAIKNALYLTFIGYGKNNTVVKEDERIQFVLKNGDIVDLDARVQLPANESSVKNVYIHYYYLSNRKLEQMKSSPVLLLRVYSKTSVNDIAVKKKGAEELMELSELFWQELRKY